jgi:hypothetical protein
MGDEKQARGHDDSGPHDEYDDSMVIDENEENKSKYHSSHIARHLMSLIRYGYRVSIFGTSQWCLESP